MAAPMAGTCEVVTPAMILAIFLVLPVRFAAVSFGWPASRQHHLGVILLCRAGHDCGDVLEGQAIGRGEFRRVIDVAAKAQHFVPLALEDRLLLLRRHREAVEIRALVFLERLAPVSAHHRHAEHVEPIAGARALRVEDIGPRYVFVGFLFLRQLTSPNRAASDCRPTAPSATTRSERYVESYRPEHRHPACVSSCSDAANPYPITRDPGTARPMFWRTARNRHKAGRFARCAPVRSP